MDNYTKFKRSMLKNTKVFTFAGGSGNEPTRTQFYDIRGNEITNQYITPVQHGMNLNTNFAYKYLTEIMKYDIYDRLISRNTYASAYKDIKPEYLVSEETFHYINNLCQIPDETICKYKTNDSFRELHTRNVFDDAFRLMCSYKYSKDELITFDYYEYYKNSNEYTYSSHEEDNYKSTSKRILNDTMNVIYEEVNVYEHGTPIRNTISKATKCDDRGNVLELRETDFRTYDRTLSFKYDAENKVIHKSMNGVEIELYYGEMDNIITETEEYSGEYRFVRLISKSCGLLSETLYKVTDNKPISEFVVSYDDIGRPIVVSDNKSVYMYKYQTQF